MSEWAGEQANWHLQKWLLLLFGILVFTSQAKLSVIRPEHVKKPNSK